jgi:hypothetical protein
MVPKPELVEELGPKNGKPFDYSKVGYTLDPDPLSKTLE